MLICKTTATATRHYRAGRSSSPWQHAPRPGSLGERVRSSTPAFEQQPGSVVEAARGGEDRNQGTRSPRRPSPASALRHPPPAIQSARSLGSRPAHRPAIPQQVSRPPDDAQLEGDVALESVRAERTLAATSSASRATRIRCRGSAQFAAVPGERTGISPSSASGQRETGRTDRLKRPRDRSINSRCGAGPARPEEDPLAEQHIPADAPGTSSSAHPRTSARRALISS